MILRLNSIASTRVCEAGTVLFIEGSIGDQLVIVLSGEIKLHVGPKAGRRLAVHMSKAGEVLDLMPAITDSPHLMDAETSCLCYLASVRTTEFREFLATYPQIWCSVASELARSYEWTCCRLRTVGYSSSNTAKLARLLLEWSAEGHPTERGIEIQVRLNQSEIAECIGVHREAVSRILGSMQRRQVIMRNKSSLTIINRQSLELCAIEGNLLANDTI
jgi:CRP-like cAMP-binding protein